ncbi:hypothetical protein QAD02_021234 [Eretmocerus hayati]|uniref:Uncharacterized protein n=1 Tax=Eretmocerus hayati TaxID=131215 RepID=A0ACC2PR36_9HYME|nr:hypothetical protein QAD02_021234 [Eretmocerus hayati]
MSQIADHWALLVEGYYKLLQTTVTREDAMSAHELFKEFVFKAEVIYSKEFMTSNVHQLLHLAQSVIDWGPLWSHNGYVFECKNADYLKQIHSPKGVVQQVCRSVAMRQSEVILRRHVAAMEQSSVNDYVNYLEYSGAKKTSKLDNERYFGSYRKPSQSERARMELTQNARIYKKMVRGGCLYRGLSQRSVRSDDSYAQLKDGSYIHIVEFVIDLDLDRSVTVCKRLQVRQAFELGSLPTVIIVEERDSDEVIETSLLNSICVPVQIDDVIYLTAPPNLYRN